ncbi:unnamed protein product [Strongylus vulgaris]|uniref:Protein OS9-like domain-containing protein n=1 Tax=Strongylus vulgaris TaxID=40348 RepID=A0A3P7IFB1_STRVU|nr:unnamed protein product [Strongylus vulgaris]
MVVVRLAWRDLPWKACLFLITSSYLYHVKRFLLKRVVFLIFEDVITVSHARMLSISQITTTFILLRVLPTSCFSGWYDIEEVRNTLYEPDISSVLSGINPTFNLSILSPDNKDSILEKIYEEMPTRDNKSYIFIKSKTGQIFACRLPLVKPQEKPRETSYNPKYLAELVSASFYVKNCITKDLGWWKYKLCRGIDVKQFHGAKNEAAQITNSLGIFLGKYAVPQYQVSLFSLQ